MHINYNLFPPGVEESRRVLQPQEAYDRMKPHFETIRIRPFWTPSITNMKDLVLQQLIKDYVASSIHHLSRFLKVVRVPGALVFRTWDNCFHQTGPSFMFNDNRPFVGVVDTDVLLLIAFKHCDHKLKLAEATPCVRDQYGRPILGYLNLCQGLASRFHLRGYASDVVLHEIGHILMMSFGSNMRQWPKFWSWERNAAIPSSEYAVQKNGKTYIRTPLVKKFVRDHFNCDSEEIPGAQLENAGGGGTALTHWDERYYHSAVMSGKAWEIRSIWTNLTLALMHDSGWYQVDFSYAGPFNWGKGAGCDFLLKDCIESGNVKHGQYFCNDVLDGGCTFDHLNLGWCQLKTKLKAVFKEEAKAFEYTAGGTRGGSSLSDFCPFRDWWTSMSKITPFCGDSRIAAFSFYGHHFAHSPGINSRCVTIRYSSKGRPNAQGFCTPMFCRQNPLSVTIMLPDKRKIKCLEEDSLKVKAHEGKAMSLSTFGAANLDIADNSEAKVECPDVRLICGQKHAFSCLWGWYREAETLPGCVCLPGFAGKKCDQDFQGTVGVDAAIYPFQTVCATVWMGVNEPATLFRLRMEEGNRDRYTTDTDVTLTRNHQMNRWDLRVHGWIFSCSKDFLHLCEFKSTSSSGTANIVGVKNVFVCPSDGEREEMQPHSESRVPTPQPTYPPKVSRIIVSGAEWGLDSIRTLRNSKEFMLHNWPFTFLLSVLLVVFCSIAKQLGNKCKKKTS